MIEGKGSALVLIIVLLVSDVMHDHSMFEGSCSGKRLVSLAERDIEGGASDGDAAPRIRGSNTQ